jgi:hypothetical protein
MQCILYKIYFWKVFHMYYNLICIFICTPICIKFYSCKKWVLQKFSPRTYMNKLLKFKHYRDKKWNNYKNMSN